MKHILVVGCGSIGRRHLRNYKELGCMVSAVDPRQDRLEEATKIGLKNWCFQLDDLSKNCFKGVDGIVIATPPSLHFGQCIEVLKHNIPIFLEKPGTKTLTESQIITQNSNFSSDRLLLGYCYRWWPSIQKLGQYIQDGKVGKIYSADFRMSAHMDDWHPYEKYDEWFLARGDLGGGCLMDENHFLDLMILWWGMPKSITATLRTIGPHDIDVEDNVDIIFEYEDGKVITMHLDMLARPHEKAITIRGDDGTLKWDTTPDYTENWIESSNSIIWDIDRDEKRYHRFIFDRNDMFMDEARQFLDIIDGQAKPSCTLNDGIRVLQLIEAAKQSSEESITISNAIW